eukprot:2126006-Pyramimonas_sp.AAC.1
MKGPVCRPVVLLRHLAPGAGAGLKPSRIQQITSGDELTIYMPRSLCIFNFNTPCNIDQPCSLDRPNTVSRVVCTNAFRSDPSWSAVDSADISFTGGTHMSYTYVVR